MKIKNYSFISEEKKKYLLKKSRNILISNLDDSIALNTEEFIFKDVSGLFVTLKKNNKLRGCIGQINLEYIDEKTLYKTTSSAMKNDHRFDIITIDEIPNLKIEITVLEKFKLINSIEEINIGEHGLLIKNGSSQGLLLPQVATENNFDVKSFLEHTSIKAGLGKEDWKDPKSEIYVFKGEVFGE